MVSDTFISLSVCMIIVHIVISLLSKNYILLGYMIYAKQTGNMKIDKIIKIPAVISYCAFIINSFACVFLGLFIIVALFMKALGF